MTKRPANFETWLHYHRQVVGVCRFYLRVEDTPWLERYLASPTWRDCVVATYAQCTLRDWVDQTQRQRAHVARSIMQARTDGMTHLLHIDDDELLYCAQGAATLRDAAIAAGPERCDLHSLTLEAIVPSESCADPFREARVFRHCTADFCSYGGDAYCTGKSIGVLRHPNLVMAGPHHFDCHSWDRGGEADCAANGPITKSSTKQLVLPTNVAVTVHFESCVYDKWLDKFTDYAWRLRTEGSSAIAKARTFNAFYHESIHACAQRMEARTTRGAGADAGAGGVGAIESLIGHYSADDAEENCRDFWRSHKLEPADMPPRGAQRVVICDKRDLTLMAPLASALPPLAPARPTDEAASCRDAKLEPPRCRRWRVCHDTMCWVREAPRIASNGLDLRQPFDIIDVDAEIDGEGGERWVRLAEAFVHSTSGFMLIDGTSLGFGRLLEPLLTNPIATGHQMMATATPVAATPPPSLAELLVHAGFAEDVATLYSEKLRDASDGVIGEEAVELECSTAELGDACRRAKLPVGHRLSLVNALQKLRRV